MARVGRIAEPAAWLVGYASRWWSRCAFASLATEAPAKSAAPS